MKSTRPSLAFAALLIVCQLSMIGASSAQTIGGKVVDRDSTGLSDVTVSITGLGRSTSTDRSGDFKFEKVPPGDYVLRFMRIGYENASAAVSAKTGIHQARVLVIMKSEFISLRDVTVTAQPQPQSIANSSQSISIVDRSALSASAGSSPSSALSDLPGVSLVHSGPFSEKPVIRGLGYQRVVILEDGVRHEYQSWDDDDSPGIDALSLERIEIVRGPNSVLYGSDALGGVVNYIHDDGTLGNGDTTSMRGEVTLEGLSNNSEGAAHASLNGHTAAADYYLDVTARGAGNVATPHGVLPNTGATELNFGGSVSADHNWGTLLLGYSRFDQHRDILAMGNDDDDEGDSPYQSTTHDRAWISYRTLPSVSRFLLDLVLQQNDGAEYSDDDAPLPVNDLRQRSASIDAKYYYDGVENNSATAGITLRGVQNATLGPEPVIPAYRQSTGAAFLYDSYQLRTLDMSFGLRYDRRYLVTSDNAVLNLTGQSRSYHAFTGSFGLLWHTTQNMSLGIDVGSGWRAPEVEELFINGVQEGSLMYKFGNPELLPEQSFSTDFIARITGDIVSGEMSAYYNRISRYIYLGPTGEIDSVSGYVDYLEQQANATLAGVDARISALIAPRIALTIGGDFITARNEDEHTWLPLTPANRMLVQIRYAFVSSSFVRKPYFETESDIVFDQNKVAPDEMPTGGYAVFNLHFGGDIMAFDRPITVDCQVHNLLDRAYYDNMSLYRMYAYEPGTDFRLNITVPFSVIE